MKSGKNSWATRKRLDRLLHMRLTSGGFGKTDASFPGATSVCGVLTFLVPSEGRRRCGNCGNFHLDSAFMPHVMVFDHGTITLSGCMSEAQAAVFRDYMKGKSS